MSSVTIAGETAGHACHNPAETALFGFWIYILSDCILFGTLFATFGAMSHSYAGGPTGKDLFDLPYVFGETMLLLCSSVTYGFAMIAAQRKTGNAVIGWLAITFLLGSGFIGMELNEFHHQFVAGNGPARSGYLSAYFTLVGTHGVHVMFGLFGMAVMMARVARNGLPARIESQLQRLSLFWHFLDIVWIAVFSTVYLLGVI